jgi:glycosyltransferase involved in cell wall biosynthesis
MSLSVALCTYNGASFIAEQLQSILDQTSPPDEIVVSDDGSTDGTLNVVDRVFSTWRREWPDVRIDLRVLRNQAPLGVAANFEQALVACTGELIALSDQDDVWHPNRLERVVCEFNRRPELFLLHTDARLVDEGGRPSGQTVLGVHGVSVGEQLDVHHGQALKSLLRRNIATGATMTIRRTLLDLAVPIPSPWVHDEWLAMVAAITGVVDVLPETLVDYRQHNGNQIGASSLDAVGKLGRLQAPRTERNARLLDRAIALQTRASALLPHPSPYILAMIDAKVMHERARSALPRNRLQRILPVLRELRSGRYCQFGLGLQDVLRDLVQPT